MSNKKVHPYPVKTEIKNSTNEIYIKPLDKNTKPMVVDPKTIDRLTGQIIIPGFSHQR